MRSEFHCPKPTGHLLPLAPYSALAHTLDPAHLHRAGGQRQQHVFVPPLGPPACLPPNQRDATFIESKLLSMSFLIG